MKKKNPAFGILLLGLGCSPSLQLNAQTTHCPPGSYQIKYDQDRAKYFEAINLDSLKTVIENSRLHSTRNTIDVMDGIEVEILSVEELNAGVRIPEKSEIRKEE